MRLRKGRLREAAEGGRLYERRGRELEIVDEIVATHVGCEYGEYDQTDEHFNKEH